MFGGRDDEESMNLVELNEEEEEEEEEGSVDPVAPVTDETLSIQEPPLEVLSGRQPKEGYLYCAIVMTVLNIFNYIDRFVPSSTKEYMKHEWQLSDEQTGYPFLCFLLTLMVTSPCFATMADWGVSRKLLLFVGIFFWSASSAGAYFAVSFGVFLATRAGVGIGEASFGTLAYVLLSDFFPPEKRNKVLGIFYAAGPVGAALGFILGGQFGSLWGWRVAFLVTGVPGFLLAFLVLFLKDPGQGAWEQHFVQEPWGNTFKQLIHNKTYVLNLMASWYVTFGVGAMADWLPTYFYRSIPGLHFEDASLIMGGVTVIGGIGGSIAGSLIADRLAKYLPKPYFLVCSLGVISSSVMATISLFILNIIPSALLLLLSEFLLFLHTGPSSATMANAVHSGIRARAFAILIFVIHLGDAVSPTVVGFVSDKTGYLGLGVSLVPLSFLLGGILFGLAWYMTKNEEDQMEVEKQHFPAETETEREETSIPDDEY